MNYIINNISRSLQSSYDDYGFYKVVETNFARGYVLVESREDGKRYKITVKETNE